MRFWFARGSQIPIKQQLVTQVVLGILCQEIKAGQRLPGIRELARRFQLHPNTVSAAYRQLARDHWVEFRRGSGVYVSGARSSAPASSQSIEELIASLLIGARDAGISRSDLRSHLRQWLEMLTPDHFLFIEPDEELRRIVHYELERIVTLPVQSCGLTDISGLAHSAVFLVLPTKAAMVRQILPPGVEVLALTVRSVPSSLAAWLPSPKDALVGIVSRWLGFLDTTRTMLVAAGFDPDCLIVRDARQTGWRKGIEQAAGVVCDSAIAAELPRGAYAIVFPIISDAAIEDLRRCEQLLTDCSVQTM